MSLGGRATIRERHAVIDAVRREHLNFPVSSLRELLAVDHFWYYDRSDEAGAAERAAEVWGGDRADCRGRPP